MKKYGADKGTLDADGAFHADRARTRSSIRPAPARSSSVAGRSARRSSCQRNDELLGQEGQAGQARSSGRSPTTRRACRRCRPARSMRSTSSRRRTSTTIQGDSNLKVLNRPAFNVAYVRINQAGPPMNELKVRQAVAYGLNRAAGRADTSTPAGRRWRTSSCRRACSATRTTCTKYAYNPTKAQGSCSTASSCHVPLQVDFWYPTDVSRPYMPDPKRNFEAFAASLSTPASTSSPHSAPWRPTYVPQVERGHGRRSEPDRLDG